MSAAVEDVQEAEDEHEMAVQHLGSIAEALGSHVSSSIQGTQRAQVLRRFTVSSLRLLFKAGTASGA